MIMLEELERAFDKLKLFSQSLVNNYKCRDVELAFR